ncbi:MAG: GGDEF domain-containing protein, partial [Lachnospiraceae bacterium]|nr:GGDEF domain-containing protein [Lachnospiraceae bacterium]
EDRPIPEVGVDEFRYLAQAYNKMHAKTQNSLEHLNYKASHDELTGAYNRAGYDVLLSGMDLESTYMMLLDVDNFKSINDTYGHETGDKVLVKVVDTLNSVFRDDDCICRIGGDEFVVLMVHSSDIPRRLIESKIEQLKERLENTGDGLPKVSISIGIVHGRDVTDTSTLFEKSDEAMYASKKHGKNTYTFY